MPQGETMSLQTEEGKGKRRAAGKGRMDADKQPAVKKPKVIAERIEELVELHNKAQAAGERAKEAITKAAEDSGYLAAAVRKIVTAKAGEKFEEKHREVEQQLELFEEVA
jgi:hypothetical protein